MQVAAMDDVAEHQGKGSQNDPGYWQVVEAWQWIPWMSHAVQAEVWEWRLHGHGSVLQEVGSTLGWILQSDCCFSETTMHSCGKTRGLRLPRHGDESAGHVHAWPGLPRGTCRHGAACVT